MFEIVFLVFVSCYFLLLFFVTLGAVKKFPKISEEELLSVSIIVAARNEEDNILDCMKSLNDLEYPAEKIEIIIVDDHSTDNTGQIISDYISDKAKFKTIIPSESFGNLKGKANALANAIKVAKGEIILTTDADCVVASAWAKTIASYYTKDVAFVGGYTTQLERTTFEGMQALDFIYLLTVAAGTINLGKPLSCIGNNMSYRKSAYDEAGGYEKIPFSVTEDFQVLMAIHNLKKYKIIYPLDVNALVTSKPCPNVKSLLKQKKRWGVGGLESDVVGFGIMAIGFVTHIAILLTPFIFSVVSLYLSAFKIITDYFFLYPVYRTLNLELRIKHFLAFEVYYILYVILLPFIVLPNKKVEWKGREYV
ncbi:MAG: glycosyl transferase [Ignavibacteria bacterium RBG_13_36_8]|nr:MAG: glycosyl transferase [Ignavibacteria bacterium RBG_13_36_8]